MSDTLGCPSCGRRLRVPAHLQGQEVQCPECGTMFKARSEGLDPTGGGELPAEGIQSELPRRPTPERQTDYSERPLERLPARRRSWEDDEEYAYKRQEMPRELPGTGLAIAVMVLLALTVCADLGAIAVNAVQAQQAPKVAPKAGQANEADELAELFSNPFTCVQPLLLLPTAILFLIWVYRTYSNLSLFRVSGLAYSPGWAVGYYFIPIMSLFRPYQIAQETWRASDPAVPLDDRRAWRNGPGSPVILIWWLIWVIGGVVGQVYLRMALTGKADAEPGKLVDILSDGLSVLAGIFAILMIYGMRKRQMDKFEQVVAYRSERQPGAG